ncbi:MAG: extracellular solute-binding protein [Pseudomonadota bacterium]|nr:extracellular solute-binding protein [Pseudomonadota bacterium]
MKKTPLRRLIVAAVFALPALLSVHAPAQTPARGSMAELAQYTGADRTQRLIEGAKKEGNLSIYTSAQTDDMGALVAGFEKKYGIKVSVWRASSEKVLQRAVAEARGNRFTVDIVETNGPELESLHREKIFQAVKSPHLANLIPAALHAHGEWVGTRLNVFVQAYNTKLVKKEELPKTWDDLLNPRWKGRLGIEAEDQDWLAGVASELGEARSVKLFKDIVAANGISVRKGHTLLTQLVVSGEIPFALTVYNYKAEQLKQKGAPIDWLSIGTAIARPNGVGVARQAPNPHAAILFYDYEISEEGQKILVGRDFVPTNTKVDSPFNKLPMKFVDARMMLDEYEKWTKLYEEIFAVRAR